MVDNLPVYPSGTLFHANNSGKGYQKHKRSVGETERYGCVNGGKIFKMLLPWPLASLRRFSQSLFEGPAHNAKISLCNCPSHPSKNASQKHT
jgi:hypothetical protein